jgi:protocatechuate 3,4-dioxygenase beta subunit
VSCHSFGRILVPVVAALTLLLPPVTGMAAAGAADSGGLSGIVQDTTGKPFVAADIVLADRASGAIVAAGRSDGAGRYDLAVGDGTYDLSVVGTTPTGERRARIDDVQVHGTSKLNVTIVGEPKPSVDFRGSVRDGDGRPVPFATVSAGGTTVTDPDGKFDLQTPAGEQTLTVERPLPEGSRITVEAPGFTLSGDRQLDVAIKTVGLTVHVRDTQGRPVPGVRVDAWSDESCESCTGAFQIAGLKTSRRTNVRRTTDGEGTARLQALPAKSVRVSVEPPYLSGWSYVVQDGVTLNGDTELTMTVGWDMASAGNRFAAAAAPSGAASLTGTARTTDGTPLTDAEVRLLTDSTIKAESRVQDDGSYSLSAPPGRYTLVVDGPPEEPDGWEPGDTVEVDSYWVTIPNFDLSADQHRDLTVPASVVSLRVLDPSGVPVPNAWIDSSSAVDAAHPFEVAPGLSASGSAASHWFTDAGGIARIRLLPGAPADVSIAPPGGRGLSGNITVPAGTTGTYDTRLKWGPTLRGRMLTPDGQPSGFGPGTLGGEPLAFGPDGTYAVTVPPGRYSLSLGGPDVFYRPSESERWASLTTDETIEVTADRTLDLTIPSPPATVVSAVDVAGRPAGEWGNFTGSSFEPITVAPGIQANTSFGVWEPGSWSVSTDLPILSPTAINARLGYDDIYGADSYDIKGARVFPGEPTIFAAAYGTTLPTPDAPEAQAEPGATPGSMSVHWTPPASEGDITAYLIVPDHDFHAATWTPAPATAGELRCLTPGNAYQVTVYALSNYGLSGGIDFIGTAADGAVTDPNACTERLIGGDTGNPTSPDGPGGTAGPADGGPGGGPTAGVSGTTKAPTATSGYWLLADDGAASAFGGAADLPATAALPAGVKAVDLEPTPARDGYWLLATDGTVHPAGAAPPLGSLDRSRLATGERPTSLSATPTGRGYWIFTDRGRVVPFGDAVSFGDMAGTTLNGPVLDSIATPTGRGYYMVASDGGIFAFGDAAFAGSMGGKKLNAPVRSLVPDPDGSGYWLVASDGGVFAFDAGFRGSMGGTHLNRPVTGMVPYGNGYLMVAEDGGVFTFSDLPFAGSLGSRPPTRPIVSVASAAR